jgi:hypothetical protein
MGLRSDHAGVVRQHREAMINPYVMPVAPRLRWHTEGAGWNLLAFDYIPAARHADYTPGSADLPAVVQVLDRLQQIPCPDLPVKRAEQRWAAYLDDDAARDLLVGQTLLHTDFNPLNVLIGDGTAWIIDWAWPTRGAAFIDPACFLLRLMIGGHTAAEAEAWAAQCECWAVAPDKAIDAFALACARLYAEIAHEDPSRGNSASPQRGTTGHGTATWQGLVAVVSGLPVSGVIGLGRAGAAVRGCELGGSWAGWGCVLFELQRPAPR